MGEKPVIKPHHVPARRVHLLDECHQRRADPATRDVILRWHYLTPPHYHVHPPHSDIEQDFVDYALFMKTGTFCRATRAPW